MIKLPRLRFSVTMADRKFTTRYANITYPRARGSTATVSVNCFRVIYYTSKLMLTIDVQIQ